MYLLQVTAGPSLDEETHSVLHVNSEDKRLTIDSNLFSGTIAVRVDKFKGIVPHGSKAIETCTYFEAGDGLNQTFSIEASGIYKTEGLTADDLLFGIVFRQSIIDRLPSTYPLGLSALQWFYPNIDFQLEGDKPTVLAPLLTIATRTTAIPISPTPATNQATARREDIAPLLKAQPPNSRASGNDPSDATFLHTITASEPVPAARGWFRSAAPIKPHEARQQWLGNQEVRKAMKIGVEDTNVMIETDFANGFIDFGDLTLRIPGFPFPVSLGHYMEGRPIQYCCMSRDRSKLYWCVVFTIMDAASIGNAV